MDTLWLACTQIPDSQKESRSSAYTALFAQFRYSECWGKSKWWEPFWDSGFPDTSQGPALQAGISKDKQSQAPYVNRFLQSQTKTPDI